MLYRKFGKAQQDVSILGFGAMRMPVLDNDDSKIDEEKAIELIRHCIDKGINYIDTAYPYHGRNSELVVAKALKDGYREKVKLVTKLPSWDIKTREDMDKFLDLQLERLEADYIDFFLLHALNDSRWDNYKKLDVYDFIEKAIASGKIKEIGFSFHDELPVFKKIVDEYDWSFCMIQYNFMDENYQAGKEGLHYAKEKGISVAIMEPLRGGNLARNIPDDVMKVWESTGVKRSPVQWAFRYLWDQEEVSIVLSGMGTIEEVDENIEEAKVAHSNSLTDKEKEALDKVQKIYNERMAVNCTGCNYCMPCPVGVNIPRCFGQLNVASMYQNVNGARREYNFIVRDGAEASKCVECGKCEKACPQNIKIIDKLKEVTELLR